MPYLRSTENLKKHTQTIPQHIYSLYMGVPGPPVHISFNLSSFKRNARKFWVSFTPKLRKP